MLESLYISLSDKWYNSRVAKPELSVLEGAGAQIEI